MNQRLAAVMSADIVDYTRLMGADQVGTLRALRSFRTDVLRPAASDHSGAIIKDMGDGWLVEFSSVANAVGAALALQEALAGHDLLRLRIGVNIGDIVHEAEDIFGDGVNIAARLQTIAPVGGIAISGSAYNSLDGTLATAFSNAGLHELKNVSRPVHVWMRGPASGDASRDLGAGAASQGLVRLAIEPIVVPRNSPDLAELADSISADLLRLLGSAEWIAPRIDSTASGADFALVTELRVRGDQIRLDIRLFGELRESIWSGAFDGFISDQFAWQDRVALEVAANVVGAITDSERIRLFEQPVEALSADECVGCAVLESFEVSEDALSSALEFIRYAIERDPDSTPAYAYGLRCLTSAMVAGFRECIEPWSKDLREWMDRLQDSDDHRIKLSLYRAVWKYGDERAPDALRDSVSGVLAQAPLDPDVLCLGGWAHVWLGEPDRAIACFRKFERIGQFNSMTLLVRGGMAMALVQAGRDVAARAEAGNILRQTCDFPAPMLAMVSASAHLGELDDAHRALSDIRGLLPDSTVQSLQRHFGFADGRASDRLLAGLRLAGLPDA